MMRYDQQCYVDGLCHTKREGVNHPLTRYFVVKIQVLGDLSLLTHTHLCHFASTLDNCKISSCLPAKLPLVQTDVVELARCWQNIQCLELMKEKGLGLLSISLCLNTY